MTSTQVGWRLTVYAGGSFDVFWLGLLAVFWLRNDPKTVVILWFLFVYSPIKLSKRRIKFDQHFPITLHQAVHNARVSPSSLVASTTTLRLQ